MQIGNVLEKGPSIDLYDETSRTLFTKPAGTRRGDGPKGCTITTVSIRSGLFRTYDGSRQSAPGRIAPISVAPGPPRRRSNADIRPGVAVAAQMSAVCGW